MNKLTMLQVAARAGFSGSGGRIGRSLRDGCIALALFTASSYWIVNGVPAGALSPIAAVLGADLADPAAEAMLRVGLFGGHVLQAAESAKVVAVGSFLARVTLAAVSAVVAARRNGEAANA